MPSPRGCADAFVAQARKEADPNYPIGAVDTAESSEEFSKN